MNQDMGHAPRKLKRPRKTVQPAPDQEELPLVGDDHDVDPASPPFEQQPDPVAEPLRSPSMSPAEDESKYDHDIVPAFQAFDAIKSSINRRVELDKSNGVVEYRNIEVVALADEKSSPTSMVHQLYSAKTRCGAVDVMLGLDVMQALPIDHKLRESKYHAVACQSMHMVSTFPKEVKDASESRSPASPEIHQRMSSAESAQLFGCSLDALYQCRVQKAIPDADSSQATRVEEEITVKGKGHPGFVKDSLYATMCSKTTLNENGKALLTEQDARFKARQREVQEQLNSFPNDASLKKEFEGLQVYFNSNTLHLPATIVHPTTSWNLAQAPIHSNNLTRLFQATGSDAFTTAHSFTKEHMRGMFSAHTEDLFAPFVHHQQSGASVWQLVDPGDLDKIPGMAVEALNTVLSSKGRGRLRDLAEKETPDISVDVLKDLCALVINLKCILFPPQLMKKHHVRFQTVTLEAGHALVGVGHCLHQGAAGSNNGVGEAINILTEDWLLKMIADGSPLRVHFERCKRLFCIDKSKEVVPNLLHRVLTNCDVYQADEADPDHMRDSLNVVPFKPTCELLSHCWAVLNDFILEEVSVTADDRSKLFPTMTASSKAELDSKIQSLGSLIEFMHSQSVHQFYLDHYKSESHYVCDQEDCPAKKVGALKK